MKAKAKPMVAGMALVLAGCINFCESEYPATQLASVPQGSEIKVQLAGFEAQITSYVPVCGYETVMIAGGGPGPRHHLHPVTTMTTTYVPQVGNTTVFIERASELMEKSMFDIRSNDPKYRVEVKFDGPFVTDGERAAMVSAFLFSLLTWDYSVEGWTARLKIYDAKSGKLLMSNDYLEHYHVNAWGPIPIFSPAASTKNTREAMQSRCLTALVDRTIADATAFLVSQK